MGAKKPNTPRSKVRAALRALWLRSRERAAALKREGNTCQCCGVKASTAKGREQKVEVHHIECAIPWDHLIDEVYRHLLCEPGKLAVVCPDCHKKIHETGEF